METKTNKENTMNNTQTSVIKKQVEWSYPSSTNAVAMGFGKVGCWTVETVEYSPGPNQPEAVKGFTNSFDANDYAEALPFAWNHAGGRKEAI